MARLSKRDLLDRVETAIADSGWNVLYLSSAARMRAIGSGSTSGTLPMAVDGQDQRMNTGSR
jgi:hypothetical protein